MTIKCFGVRLSVSWRYVNIEILSRLLLGLVGAIIYFAINPFIRRVYSQDWSDYSYPFIAHETFPAWSTSVMLFCVPVALAVFCLLGMVWYGKWPRKLVLEESLFLVLAVSLSCLLGFITCELIKRTYGRPRPDYLSRCFGDLTPTEMKQKILTLPDIPECNNTELSKSEMKDGRMSFPSEHSALSFCIILPISLWIYGKLCIYHVGAFRIAIPAIILTLPLAVAVSRTSDYRHHPTDVLGGILIGILFGTLSYMFYYGLTMKPITSDVYKLAGKAADGKSARLFDVNVASLHDDFEGSPRLIGNENRNFEDD